MSAVTASTGDAASVSVRYAPGASESGSSTATAGAAIAAICGGGAAGEASVVATSSAAGLRRADGEGVVLTAGATVSGPSDGPDNTYAKAAPFPSGAAGAAVVEAGAEGAKAAMASDMGGRRSI